MFDSENQKINTQELYTIVTSIDIQTPQISHEINNVEVSTDVGSKQEKLSLGTNLPEVIPQLTAKDVKP